MYPFTRTSTTRALEAAQDAARTDQTLRLVFADHVQEMGCDDLAAGYRALAAIQWEPGVFSDCDIWCGTSDNAWVNRRDGNDKTWVNPKYDGLRRCFVHDKWFVATDTGRPWVMWKKSFAELTFTLASAFTRLSPADQATALLLVNPIAFPLEKKHDRRSA